MNQTGLDNNWNAKETQNNGPTQAPKQVAHFLLRHKMIRCLALLITVALVLAGCGQKDKNHVLVRWPDGTNNCYAIEAERGKGSLVIIPDVRFIQTSEQFVIGRADWKYLEGFQQRGEERPLTNEFWFALDKHEDYPKCYVLITTNEQVWAAWCMRSKVSTNLQQVGQFLQAIQSAPSYQGGNPRL